ncbi:MAG TPA: response regulator [Actinomycetota bacterium]|nr:response regulator [Actinomycetota bacterium]
MPRVLLVDDDPTILRLLEVNFRLEGFETRSAACGEDAVVMAAERPDAIVLDVTLPDMDGHDVYERIRGDRSLPPIPIVFLSARVRDEELARYGAAPVRFVAKPFDTAVLVQTVRAAIVEGGP